MKVFFIGTAALFGAVIIIGALSFVATGGNLAMFAFFAPKYAAVQRQVYVQTPSFVLGNQADLEQQARSYNQATDPAQKATILSGLQSTVDNLGSQFPVPQNVRVILSNQ